MLSIPNQMLQLRSKTTAMQKKNKKKQKQTYMTKKKLRFGMTEWIIVKSGETKISPTVEHIKAAFFSVKWWEVSSSHPIIKVPEYPQVPGLGEGRLNFNNCVKIVFQSINTGYMLLCLPVSNNHNTVRCHILGVLGPCVGVAPAAYSFPFGGPAITHF